MLRDLAHELDADLVVQHNLLADLGGPVLVCLHPPILLQLSDHN